MTAALAIGSSTAHPVCVLPLAVGSLYASANDRLYADWRRVAHLLLPAVAGSVGMLAGLALHHVGLLALVLVPAVLGFCAGVISAVGPTASAAGLQLLALAALGEGLPDSSGPWWLPALLLLAGAALVAVQLAGHIAVKAGLTRPTAPAGAIGEVLVAHTDLLQAVSRRLVTGSAHGVRLAAAAVLAVIVSHAMHPARGYWLLLTVALVVKPEITSVARRAAHRGAGTVVGLAVTAAVLAYDPGAYGLWLVVVVATAVVPWAADHSYGALTASIVPVVFALLRLVGVTGNGLLGWRLVDTAVGLAIAILVGHDWRLRPRPRGRRAPRREGGSPRRTAARRTLMQEMG